MASKNVAAIFLQVSVDRLKTHVSETKKALEEKKDLNQMKVPYEFLNKLICDTRVNVEKLEHIELTESLASQITEASTAIFNAEHLSTQLKNALEHLYVTHQEKPQIVSQPIVHKPKLEIRHFDGKHSDFTPFWQYFERHYHSNPNYDAATKFDFLTMHVKGDAAILLKYYKPTAENYESAVQLLKQRYGDRKITIPLIYKEIKATPKATLNLTSLKHTFDTLEAELRALENLDERIDENSLLLDTLIEKFPEQFYIQASIDLSSIKSFRSSISATILQREYISVLNNPSPSQNISLTPVPNTTTALVAHKTHTNTNSTRTPAKPSCILCGSEHWTTDCTQYSTYEERRKKIEGSCYNCLKPNHSYKNCSKKQKPCFYCKKKGNHHACICPVKFGIHASKPKQMLTTTHEKKPAPSNTISLLSSMFTKLLTATATVADLTGTRSTKARIILDCGSDRSYVTNRCIKKLQLQSTPKEKMNMQVFGAEESKIIESCKTSLNIYTPAGEIKKLELYSSHQIIPDLEPPDISSFQKLHPEYNHFQLADDGLPHHTEILIGLDYIIDILKWNKIDVNTTTTLLDTIFGWVLTIRQPGREKAATHCLISKTLSDPLSQLWSLDTLGIRENINNPNEDLAIQHFQENICFKDDRYYVSLPWRYYPPDLPENYELAIGQLHSLWKSLKQANLLTAYDNVIQNQIKNGIVEEAPKQPSGEVIHYLPHHAVLTPEKSTTLRIVYNGSARTKQSKTSLNDCLLKGKNMIENSTAMILLFRCKVIGIISDIEKAYLQLGLHINDRDATRFIWVRNIHAPPDLNNLIILRFTRILFGIVASAFLLAATLTHHIKSRLTDDNRMIIEKILKSLYVDNFANGTRTLEEAIELYNVMKNLLAEIGMNIRQWSSNSAEFMNALPEADRNNTETVNLLGIQWKPKNDTLNIQKPSIHSPENPTKRTILQYTAAFYDPIGFFAPVILQAKLFIQKLWLLNFDWDQKLPHNLIEEWRIIQQELEKIPSFYIPRHINIEGTLQLHCFSDASKDAYAAAVYLRVTHNEETAINLMFAKTRITPPKTENELAKFTPKFELLGTLIGARILNFVEKALDQNISEKILWTDSQCTIAWINSSQILPTFIERRVNEIRQLVQKIKFVPGHMNVADIASRGGTQEDMQQAEWWNGPAWLKNETQWPENFVPEKTPEWPKSTSKIILITDIATTPPPFDLNIDKYATYEKLIAVTQKCIEAVNKFRKTPSNETWQAAEQMWIIYTQQAIKSQRDSFKHLGLFQDPNGIFRCRGRFQCSTHLSDEEKFPILLLRDSPLTKLIIMHYHTKLYHVGTQHTLAEIRRRFWIPTGRRIVYHTLKKNCPTCKKFRNKPYIAPQIPPLPASRLDPTKPFKNSGVDILGPLYVKFAPSENKRWILIFTCLVTRAIHLEVLYDLTTEDILSAFKLFFARRGVPKLLISDNAPQFKLLHTIYETNWMKALQDNTCKSYLEKNKISWKWIPQLAPWAGGVYERLIALVKESLKLTYHKITLTDRQLQVAVTEIEALINTRPLTYYGPDLNEDIITPNLFLRANFPNIIEANTNPPTVTGKSLVEAWKKADAHINQFWNLFYSKYIASLREKHVTLKQKRSTANVIPKNGDIVMLADDNIKRGHWKLAEITEIEHSGDGEIRSAKVRLSNGETTRRPIIKLIPLEVSNQPTPDEIPNEDFEIAEISCELVYSESESEET